MCEIESLEPVHPTDAMLKFMAATKKSALGGNSFEVVNAHLASCEPCMDRLNQVKSELDETSLNYSEQLRNFSYLNDRGFEGSDRLSESNDLYSPVSIDSSLTDRAYDTGALTFFEQVSSTQPRRGYLLAA